MSGTKRDSSHIDDDSNDNDQSQPTILSSSHTPANSPQNPIYISSTPPAESVMSTPPSTGAHPTETPSLTNDSGTGSGPGSSSPSNPPAKKGRGKKAAKGSKKSQSKNNENGEAGNDDGTTTKRPRKRRRKGEPEPDYTALMLQKKNNSGRVAKACDRCHECRFGCDESRGGCVLCLRDGFVCTMTNRVTRKITIRGGKAGVKVDFAKMHDDNIDLTENNAQLNQEVEQLRTENSNLRSQLEYYQSFTSSIRTIPGPNNVPPVSMLSGNIPNPQPQAMQQPNPHLSTNSQSLPANYTMNNNAFSGNMSINTPSNVPHLSLGAVSNALTSPQWAQPHLSQGVPIAPQNTAVAYPPNFFQVPSLQNNQLQAIPFQNVNNDNNQGMGYQGVPVQNFQYPPGLQVPETQYLPISRPLGTQFLNAQNQNQNNPPSQPVQVTPAQIQDANTQGQNNQNSQGQGVQEAHATQNQTNQPQATNQNQGMGYPRNQIPHNQNLQPMTTQYPGNQVQNPQRQGMGSSNTLNQGIQVPNTQAHNINTQFPGFQYTNNIQSQSQNANAHQDFANARLMYQMPQPSLFGGAQNQGMLFQPPQVLQQPSFQVPGIQYQGIASQNLSGKGLGYMNTQNPFLQRPGPPPPIPNNPAEQRGNSSSGNDADAEGESESEEYNWTPPPRSGGQYVTANTETQQTNTGGDNNNNNNNGQGEQSTLSNATTTNIQTQAIPTESLGGLGNSFDLTDTDTTLNNDILNQAPDLSSSEMQRLLGELETESRYDYTQGEQNNGNNNGGQGKYQEIIFERQVDIKPEIEVKLESVDYIKVEKDGKPSSRPCSSNVLSFVDK